MSKMNETRIELPGWLPWGTTACLAAVVACLVELWTIERARNQLLRDEGQLSESAMHGMGNQLEAERIISQREIEGLRAAAASRGVIRVVLLAAPPGAVPAIGALAWDTADGSGVIRVSGLPVQAPERDYQLWIEGAGAPARCAV
ncbi:MAG TPA: anti-sigma factor, partial [Opitutaceae bacterium]